MHTAALNSNLIVRNQLHVSNIYIVYGINRIKLKIMTLIKGFIDEHDFCFLLCKDL